MEKFDITATINGKCQSVASVYIRKSNISRDYNVLSNSAVLITGSDTPAVNKPAVYMTNTTASNYEWTILNKNEYKNQTGKMALFSFKTPGRHTIQLKLDNDRQKIYTKNIYVTPPKSLANYNKPLEPKRFNSPVLPPLQLKKDSVQQPIAAPTNTTPPASAAPVKPEEKQYVETSNKYLLKTFEEVIRGGKAISEFDSYLCNGNGTKVLINNKNYSTFEQFFNDIKGNNKRKIESVEAVWEAVQSGNKCIINIKVTVKKKNIIGRWVDL